MCRTFSVWCEAPQGEAVCFPLGGFGGIRRARGEISPGFVSAAELVENIPFNHLLLLGRSSEPLWRDRGPSQGALLRTLFFCYISHADVTLLNALQ